MEQELSSRGVLLRYFIVVRRTGSPDKDGLRPALWSGVRIAWTQR